MSSDYYKTKDVSLALGVHPTTVRQWARRGKIECVKFGRRLLFTPEMLEDMRQAQIEGKLSRPHSHTAAKLEARGTFPHTFAHLEMVLVDDPTGEFIVGFGRFEFGSWRESCIDGVWPEGSVWRGERGEKADTLYQVEGFGIKEIAEYSRHARISATHKSHCEK